MDKGLGGLLMIFLFPSMYNDATQVDDDYAIEKNVVEELGCKTLLFNFDAFVFGNKPIRISVKKENITEKDKQDVVIYRGWMLRAEHYQKLYTVLHKLGLKLINLKDEYRGAHELPHSYKYLKKYMPGIEIYEDGKEIDWKGITSKYDKFMFKDYVKSVKGLGFPEYFDSTYSSIELQEYYLKLKDLRGEDFTGGLVVKEYVSLKRDTKDKLNEYRCWFYNGRLFDTYRNIQGPFGEGVSDLNVSWVKKLPKLKSKFYTIDVAELKSGGWVVIETGDGQVSGLLGSDKPENRERVKNFYMKLIGVNK